MIFFSRKSNMFSFHFFQEAQKGRLCSESGEAKEVIFCAQSDCKGRQKQEGTIKVLIKD